jgi:excinuclease ABC subunit C
LERLRDESHRFAIKHHRKLRDKSAISSELRNIPGLGPKTETALLSVFRTVANIREASLEELMGCDLVSKYLATEIYSYFHNNLVDNVHID